MLEKIFKINYIFLSLQIAYFFISVVLYRRFELIVFLLFFGTFVFIIYNAIVQSIIDKKLFENNYYMNIHKHFKFSSFPWDDFLIYKKAKLLPDYQAITALRQRFFITVIYLLYLVIMLVFIFRLK